MIPSEEQRMAQETARQFARDRLVPGAAARDREGRFPKEALAEMGRLGLMGMLVPEEWGGAGADHVAYALALAEIAAGDGACSTIMSVHNSVGCMPILEFGSATQSVGHRNCGLHPRMKGAVIWEYAGRLHHHGENTTRRH